MNFTQLHYCLITLCTPVIRCAVIYTALLACTAVASAPSGNLKWVLEESIDEKQVIALRDSVITQQKMQRAFTLYDQGKYQQTSDILRKYLQYNIPGNGRSLFTLMLGECYRQLHISSRAIRMYRTVADTFTEPRYKPAALLRLLQTAYRHNEFETAQSIHSRFANEFADHPLINSAHYILAKFHYHRGNYTRAIDILTRIPSTSQRASQSLFLKALCNMSLDNHDQAIITLNYIREHSSDAPMKQAALHLIGNIYYEQEKTEPALTYYEKIPSSYTDYQHVQLQLMRCLKSQGNIAEAKKIAESYIEAHSFTAPLYFDYASELEKIYRSEGFQSEAYRLAATVNTAIRREGIRVNLYQEIRKNIELISEWNRIRNNAEAEGDSSLLRTADKNIKQIRQLKSYSVSLLREFRDDTGQSIMPVIAMQKYLTELKTSIRMYRDSIDTLQHLLSDIKGDSGSETSSLYDSLMQEKKYASSRLSEILRTRNALQNQYAESNNSAILRSEEKSIQYIDWAFLRYQDLKQQLKEINAHLARQDTTTTASTTKNPEVHYSDAYRDTIVKSIDTMRKTLIAITNNVLDFYPRTSYNAELLFRQAELFYDQAEAEFSTKMNTYEKKLAQGASQRQLEFPTYDMDNVIATYDEIIHTHPQHDRADDACFFKALAQQKEERYAQAARSFTYLIENYPKSSYYVETNIRLGQYYFDHPKIDGGKGYELAKEAFIRAVAWPDHPKFITAVYMLGWTYYMKDEYDKAISTFKYLIEKVNLDFSVTRKNKGKTENPLLREEAIDYIAISFDEQNEIEKAISFLKLIGNRDYAGRVLSRIGKLREEIHDFPMAIRVYERLLKEYPLCRYAPHAMSKLISLNQRMGNTRKSMDLRRAFFSHYRTGSDWRQRNISIDSGIVAKTDSQVVANGFYLADRLYKKAKESKDTSLFRKTIGHYSRIVSHYPHTVHSLDARWNIAIIQDNHLHEFQNASTNYIIYSQDSLAPKPKRKKAAMNAIAALQNLQIPDSTVQEGKLDSGALALLEATKNYVTLFPRTQKRIDVQFIAGSIYYNRSMYANAARTYRSIISTTARDSNFYSAYVLLAQCYYKQDNLPKTISICEKVYTEATAGPVRKKSRMLLTQALFEYSQVLFDAGKFKEAGDGFSRLYTKFPESEYADAATFAHAESYEKRNEWKDAAGKYLSLVETWPQSKLAPNALFNAALDYEEAKDFKRAADAYNRILDRYPKSEKSKDALFNLGFCYEKLGKYDKMAQVNERYAEKYPGEKDVRRMLLKAGEFYIKAQMYEKAQKVYKNFIRRAGNSPDVVQVYFMLGTIEAEKDNRQKAISLFRQAQRYNQKLQQQDAVSPNNRYAARASFRIAQYYRDEFESIDIQHDKDNITKKSDALKEAKKSYTRTAKYSSAHLFESLYRIGHMYESFARAYIQRPVKESDPVQEAVTKSTQYKESATILDNSLPALLKAIKISNQLDSLNAEQVQWVDSARTHLCSNAEQAGILRTNAIGVIYEAPVPQNIARDLLSYFQYQVQLHNQLRSSKVTARDYFLTTAQKLKRAGVSASCYQPCMRRFSEINYKIPHDFDALAQKIRETKDSITSLPAESQNQDLIFHLEDIAFQMEDNALFAYEDALALTKEHGTDDSPWQKRIIRRLAHLSPEMYGGRFYLSTTLTTDKLWIARNDSSRGWNTEPIPAGGWKKAKRSRWKCRYAALSSPAISFGKRNFYARRDFVLEGKPMDAGLSYSFMDTCILYVNGELVSQLNSPPDSCITDSITDIASLFSAGNNFIAVRAASSDSSAPSFSLACRLMLDTSHQLPSKPTAAQKIRNQALGKAGVSDTATTDTTTVAAPTATVDDTLQNASVADSVTLNGGWGTQKYNTSFQVQRAISSFKSKENYFKKRLAREKKKIEELHSKIEYINALISGQPSQDTSDSNELNGSTPQKDESHESKSSERGNNP